MKRRLIICLLFSGTCLPAWAEPGSGYQPDETPPKADTQHFPSGSDVETWQLALEKLKEFEHAQKEGLAIAEKFKLKGDRFEDHPWKGGRDEEESKEDWLNDAYWVMGHEPDSLERFMQCFEPRWVSPICPYCQPAYLRPEPDCELEDNTGDIWEYWWPEWEIEINAWGIVALNPIVVGDDDLLQKALKEYEKKYRPKAEKYMQDVWGADASQAAIPKGLRKAPHIGNSQFAGLLPGDQTYVEEAHVYRTNVAQAVSELRPRGDGIWDFRYEQINGKCVPISFFYNGYVKGHERCFYDSTPQKTKTIIGLTEEAKHEIYWRLPEFSALLDEKKYQVSVPMSLADTGYWRKNSCASYRSEKWEDVYGDLQSAVGIIGNTDSALSDICYYGGGSLYPATGTLMGHFSELPSAAYLARRAIEVLAHLKKKQGKGVPHFADKKRGKDSVDKLQRVFPEPTRCFQMQEIDERNEVLFPKDGVSVDDLGSKRYVYWNKRQACTCQYRGVVSPKEDENNQLGWGCQIYPKDKPKIGDGDEKKSKLNSWLGWSKSDWPPWAESAEQLYDFHYKK